MSAIVEGAKYLKERYNELDSIDDYLEFADNVADFLDSIISSPKEK